MTTSTPSTPGTELHTRWRELAAPFTAEVEAVTAWDASSPCEGWSARDVLAHVIGTEREFLAKAGLLSGGGAEAEAEDPAARWAAHLAEVDALLADPETAARPHDGAFGPTTVGAVLVEFYGFDLVVHRWDLARSQGRDARLAAEEIAMIDANVDGWGEHAYAPGVFSRPLTVPDGADEQTRVLARPGRRG